MTARDDAILTALGGHVILMEPQATEESGRSVSRLCLLAATSDADSSVARSSIRMTYPAGLEHSERPRSVSNSRYDFNDGIAFFTSEFSRG